MATAKHCAKEDHEQKRSEKITKHTAAGIPTWSPTVVLICRSTAYVWQSGRDAQFSADCGRMCLAFKIFYNMSHCRLALLDKYFLPRRAFSKSHDQIDQVDFM